MTQLLILALSSETEGFRLPRAESAYLNFKISSAMSNVHLRNATNTHVGNKTKFIEIPHRTPLSNGQRWDKTEVGLGTTDRVVGTAPSIILKVPQFSQ
jgi:hypothetical protein